MASKTIYMDGVATARVLDDGRVRIDLAPAHSNAIESSLSRIPAAIRRARPLEIRPPQPEAPVGGQLGFSREPQPQREPDRAS